MALRKFGLSHMLVLLSYALLPAIADTTGSGTSTGSGTGTGTNSGTYTGSNTGTGTGSGSFSVPGPTTGISTTAIPVPTVPLPTIPTLVPPGTTVVSSSSSSSVSSSSSQPPSGGTGTSGQTSTPPTQSPSGTGTGSHPVTTTSSSSSSLQPSPTTSSTLAPIPSGSSGTGVPTPGPTVTITSPRSSSTSTPSSTTTSSTWTSVRVVTAYATVTKIKYSTITEDYGPPTAFPPAVPVGCYNEGTNGRALPDFFFQDDVLMSIEKCVGLCPNYTFLGLEYGTQCWCGNSIQNGAFPVDIAQCDTVCAGNAREICGGDDTLSLFLPPPPLPKRPSSNITYTSAGCYAEPADGSRALKKSRTATSDMTPDSCFNICGMSGFRYAGLEYGDECWCGNRVSPAAAPVDASRCNMNCSGDATRTCGGPEFLNLYNGTYNSSTATSLSPHHASIWDRLFNGKI